MAGPGAGVELETVAFFIAASSSFEICGGPGTLSAVNNTQLLVKSPNVIMAQKVTRTRRCFFDEAPMIGLAK